MTETKPPSEAVMWARTVRALSGDLADRECDACGARLFPGDWLTRDGCCWCEAGLDILTPWDER